MAEPGLRTRSMGMPALWGCLAAIVPAVALEMALLPNLRAVPGFLALVVLTTALTALSLGLTLAGVRRRLPPPARWSVRLALWSVVAADLAVFLVIPLASPQTAREKPAQFATPAPVAEPSAGSVPAGPSAAPAVAPTTLSGQFDARRGPDSVSGHATLGRASDGRVVLAITNLDATPGPDLYVYLSTVASPSSDGQVKSGMEVGRLRATRGDLNYELDPSLDVTRFKSVVVYCRSFSVVFGFADLK